MNKVPTKFRQNNEKANYEKFKRLFLTSFQRYCRNFHIRMRRLGLISLLFLQLSKSIGPKVLKCFDFNYSTQNIVFPTIMNNLYDI